MKTSGGSNPRAETSLKINLSQADLELADDNSNPANPLKPDQRRQLEKCEDILRKGLGTFFEVGQALLAIRHERLYREDFSTFEAYCRQRWALGRTHAWHLTGAAERIKLLAPDNKTPRPTNEFQVRPFLKLAAEAFPKAWEQVISMAKDGCITPALVRGVVAQIAPQDRQAKVAGSKPKRNAARLPKACSVGRILVLLSEAKEMVENGETVKVLDTISRVELELLGMCHA